MRDGRDVLVLGGGAGGLLTALVLANGGHRVTVLERDAEPPPDTDAAAWEGWDRRGVNQMRQPHALLGRGRETLATETPDVWDAVSQRAPVTRTAPPPDPSALIDDDRRLHASVIRRVTLERLLAVAADHHRDVTVQRGVAVAGLVTGPSVSSGRPHVTGVVTDSGDELCGDLVIDALGRRTPVGEWVESLGTPVERSAESDGFTYFSRWFHRHAGEAPEVNDIFGGMAPGLLAVMFPGDGDVIGVALVGSAQDRTLRRLRDPDRYMSVARSFPLLQPWVDPTVADPITDVLPMGAIQNRHLRLRTDETAGPAGIINTADSAVSTNPSLGRGISIAGDLALELRSLLADTDDPAELADRWDHVHRTHHRPWLDDSVESDAALRAGFAAMVEQRPPAPTPNPARSVLQRAAMVDMECWRRWTTANHVFTTPDTCWADSGLMARATEAAADVPPPQLAMTRATLEAALV